MDWKKFISFKRLKFSRWLFLLPSMKCRPKHDSAWHNCNINALKGILKEILVNLYCIENRNQTWLSTRRNRGIVFSLGSLYSNYYNAFNWFWNTPTLLKTKGGDKCRLCCVYLMLFPNRGIYLPAMFYQSLCLRGHKMFTQSICLLKCI